MRTSLARLLRASALLVAAGFAGCGPSEPNVVGPPYDVLVLNRLPGGSGAASFAVQRRQLMTYADLEELTSPIFRIRQGGTVDVDASSDVASGPVFSGGLKPNLRYVVAEGVVVPRDDDTLSMLSAAYHFEHIFPLLVDATSPEVGARFAASGPMDIFFGPKIVGSGHTARGRRNAFFHSGGWQFGIVLPSPLTKVSLAAEPRVIAHELGHAVFLATFFGGPQRCDEAAADAHRTDAWFEGRLDNELVISGVNEGVADWLSFAVTGGTNPLEVLTLDSPYPNGDLQRSLVAETFQWRDVYKADAPVLTLGCFGKYCLGTLFARALLSTYLEEGHSLDDEAARHAFSRAVVAALGGTAARMRDLPLPLPSEEVARCSERDEVSLALDPPIIGAYLAAFLEGLEPARATSLCRALVKRFQEGFPEAFRTRCAP